MFLHYQIPVGTDTLNYQAQLMVTESLYFDVCLVPADSINHTDSGRLPLQKPPGTITVKQKKDGMMIRYSQQAYAGDPLLGPRKTYVLLCRDASGGLVVRSGYWGYGLVMLIIPSGVNHYTWYRFTGSAVEVVGNRD